MGLFQDILENEGTVITEYEANTEVCSKGFVQRNRIVSGLAEAVIVIEAKYRSGTSITADFAARQGKPVFCIPHSIDEREGIGTNRLLKKGAILVTDVSDIIRYFDFLSNNKKKVNKTYEVKKNVPNDYLLVYQFIKDKPINIEEIIKKACLTSGQVNYILTMLELDGYIESLPGKFFVRK